MVENYLLKGIFIGIMFGVPVGVVGIITIQRTLSRGFWAGFVSGLGSSFADVVYASISIFGLTIISDFLLKYQEIICIIGCILIIFIGIQTMKKNNNLYKQSKIKTNSSSSFLPSFMITLTNPATILSFMIIFSTFGVSGDTHFMNKLLLVMGILIGTGVWWILLSGTVKWSQKLLTDSFYNKLNQWFGLAIIILGVFIGIYSLVL